ncbi:MAG TPA: class I SAM-dependent methyltransferase [Bacteroidales bacterium]|nr:class I SAM-dependent methyltransferase [Bacteroidales bacterium]
MSKEMWDSRYAAEEYVYGKDPNAFFKAEIDKLVPGTLLLPAEGEGRNAVYAAGKHWDVHALDQSVEGRKKAFSLALGAGVTIRYDLADLMSVDLPADHFDAIGLIFVHLPSPGRNPFHIRVSEWLKPGGTLILEGFSKEQIRFTSGGPRDPDMLFSTTDLQKDFSGLEILKLEQLETFHDEGAFHRGNSSVVRMVARKKSASL